MWGPSEEVLRETRQEEDADDARVAAAVGGGPGERPEVRETGTCGSGARKKRCMKLGEGRERQDAEAILRVINHQRRRERLRDLESKGSKEAQRQMRWPQCPQPCRPGPPGSSVDRLPPLSPADFTVPLSHY